MIDDTLLQNLPEDPELGFISLVNNLDRWLGKATSSERDEARKFYGEALLAFVAERQLDAPIRTRKNYGSIDSWWNDSS